MTINNFTLKLTAAFSLVIFLNFTSFASRKVVLENVEEQKLEITSGDYHHLGLFNAVSTLHFKDIETEKGVFSILYISEYYKNLEAGHPLLPVKRELIEIPAGATPNVIIRSFDLQEIDLSEYGMFHKLYPAQPEIFKNDTDPVFSYDPEAYLLNSYGDSEIISVDVLGYMRGTRIGRVNIAPVKYNPVTNKLLVYNNIDFEIVFDDADIQKTIDLKETYYSPYFSAINSQLLNYQRPASRENFMRYPIKYVIVANPMFESQLQEFIHWKTMKGFTIVEAYTDDPLVGDTPEEIRDYLQELYEFATPDDPAPSFVLFVGDIAQVPTWNGNTGYHVTDLFYCEYTNDVFPEIYYGRFSAQNTAQLQPQIDKTLMYEKYEIPDPSYLDTVVMVAGMDGSYGQNWANGQINYGTINYFNEDHGLYSDTYLYPSSGNQSAEIRQRVSDGVSFGNYTAHCNQSGWGDPSFTVNHIPQLQNEDQYCVLIGNCCLSNDFGVDACFGEALLRAVNKGALGYIGGSNNTQWDPDYYWAVGVGQISENPPPYAMTTLGAYDRLFHDHGEAFGDWYITTDEIIYAGNFAVTEGSPNSSEYYWEIYCVMGDPSLSVYLGEPEELYANYPALIPLGASSVTITTEPYAYVGVSKDSVLYGAALADSLGIAEVPLEPITQPGEADIVITKQNCQPHFGTIDVASPQGPYIMLQNYSLNDSLGNNNGKADYGENLTMDVWLENAGQDDGENITAVLSTNDMYVVITDSLADWGTILAGDSSLVEDAFAFNVIDSIPDQHVVNFNLLIENSNNDQWEENMIVNLNAPILHAGIIDIDDSQGGNGNGMLDPGETADIIIPLSNNGHADIFDVQTLFSTAFAGITVNSGSFEYEMLAVDETVISVFNVTVEESVQIGISVGFDYTAGTGIYSIAEDYFIVIGLVMEDWETGTFTKFDWIFSGNADWQMCDQDPFEGVYCSESGVITDNQLSEIMIQYNVAMDDSISFYKKVSCEDDPWNDDYDYLAFFIDNTEMGRWDGEVAWSRESYPVTEGTHIFRWQYSKDYSESAGDDCAWIDYIVFPPEPNYVEIPEVDDYKAFRLEVFPNPTRGTANILIETSDPFSNLEVNMLNNLGQNVYNQEYSNHFDKGIHYLNIETGDFTEGIYYLVVNTGNHAQSTKLIVKK